MAGLTFGKVRSIRDSDGKSLKEARPSDAVQVSGWEDCPNVGDYVLEATSDVGTYEQWGK